MSASVKMKRVPVPERATRVQQTLATVRLTKFAKHYRTSFGGMKQRGAVARALAKSRRVIPDGRAVRRARSRPAV